MYNNFTKKLLILSILIMFFLIIMSILYNFSFKYDKHDPFFRALITRSNQLNDSFVQKKFLQGLTTLNVVFSKPVELQEIFRIIKNSNFTTDYMKKTLLSEVKGIKECGNDNCFANKYIDLYGKEFNDNKDKNFFKFKTPDGNTYALKITSNSCLSQFGDYSNYCGIGYIDINGKKGPNQLGVDLFDFGIYSYADRLEKPNPKYQVISAIPLYWNEQAKEYCLYGKGYGCSWYLAEMIPRNTYLIKPLLFKTKYKFSNYYYHIYITPHGKWVFFTQDGFKGFVTPKSLLNNIQIYLNHKKFFVFNDVKAIKTKISSKLPKSEPKNEEKKVYKVLGSFTLFGKFYYILWE